MQQRHIYAVLLVAGVVIPYCEFLPWLMRHGLNPRLFVEQLLANRISAFFGADVLVSAVVVAVFTFHERRRLGRRAWLAVAALLACGVSAALPLLLYLRSRAQSPLDQVA